MSSFHAGQRVWVPVMVDERQREPERVAWRYRFSESFSIGGDSPPLEPMPDHPALPHIAAWLDQTPDAVALLRRVLWAAQDYGDVDDANAVYPLFAALEPLEGGKG